MYRNKLQSISLRTAIGCWCGYSGGQQGTRQWMISQPFSTTTKMPSASSDHWYLNYRHFRDNADAIKENAKNRMVDADVDATIELYKEYIAVLKELDQQRAKKNAMQKGSFSEADLAQLRQQSKMVKESIRNLESHKSEIEQNLPILGGKIPNDTHVDVPVGPMSNATCVSTHGRRPEFSFKPKSHVDICNKLDLVDWSNASEIVGNKWYYLKGFGALLEWALIQYTTNFLLKQNFLPVITPDVTQERILSACGFTPRDNEASQTYYLADEHSSGKGRLCLTGTAEVPLAGMFLGKTLYPQDLPQKLVGFNHAFRTEAGGTGSTTRGLYRVHQFSKVEMFSVTHPNDSDAMLEEILRHQIALFESLDLHFKVLDMPTEELGNAAYRKYDIEAWMPGRETYGEISSASNCTDYQSRRLNLRYKEPNTPTDFCHTVNGTGCAIPRIMVALLETHQQEDGTVVVPPPLRPYLGHDTITKWPIPVNGYNG